MHLNWYAHTSVCGCMCISMDVRMSMHAHAMQTSCIGLQRSLSIYTYIGFGTAAFFPVCDCRF